MRIGPTPHFPGQSSRPAPPTPPSDPEKLPDYGPNVPPDPALVKFGRVAGGTIFAGGRALAYAGLGAGAGLGLGSLVALAAGSAHQSVRLGLTLAGGLGALAYAGRDSIPEGWQAGTRWGREWTRQRLGLPTGG